MKASPKEIMTVMAARELQDSDVVLVGVGLPNLAANLAKRLYSHAIILVYESGTIDSSPPRLPLSIGDSSLVEDTSAIFSVSELFFHIVQKGLIDVGFLGSAQVDVSGNINTTVIGNYSLPKVRLPGSGGASEISYYSGKKVIMTKFSTMKITKKVDFITSCGPDNAHGKREGKNTGRKTIIVTDLCIIEVNGNENAEIVKVYERTDLEALRIDAEKIGLQFRMPTGRAEEPTEEELRVLNGMDKGGLYLK